MEPTTAPPRPFLAFTLETDPARWDADVALLGITHSEPYARDAWPNDQTHAPDAIRAQSHQVSDGPAHWDFDLDSELGALAPPRCLDCGNLTWQGGDYEPYFARVRAAARQLLGAGTQLVVLGGDHGVTLPVLDALEALGEAVHIVHVDAHLDWRAEVGGVRRGYSSPLYWASRLPWIRGMTQLGMRGTGSARRAEVEAARAYGSRIFSAEMLHEAGFAAALAAVPADAPLYITIDADGIDPTEAPGVMAPVPGGLRFAQLAPFLRGLARRQRIVGLDIVEVAPAFDAPNGITCITAGRLIVNVLGSAWARG
ncbi:MAG: arginase family protein [Gammaproteobacteria bacterium]|nr:arginase family protein [Gammaproteobacteria bacterium]MBV9698308.1 arginase family protein [Gammaproteobacteria bacterium]